MNPGTCSIDYGQWADQLKDPGRLAFVVKRGKSWNAQVRISGWRSFTKTIKNIRENLEFRISNNWDFIYMFKTPQLQPKGNINYSLPS